LPCAETLSQVLRAANCKRLTALPASLPGLPSLERLDLFGCERLASLPESLGLATALTELDVSNCAQLTSLPESIGAGPNGRPPKT
jgi:Leucine-rich repeat (LRR) protein